MKPKVLYSGQVKTSPALLIQFDVHFSIEALVNTIVVMTLKSLLNCKHEYCTY
jgi:hypothetical protein